MDNDFYKQYLKVFEPFYQSIVASFFIRFDDLPYLKQASQTFFTPLLPLAEKGKRIRPFFLAVGSDTITDEILDAGVAFELLHLFALIHDDIMDGATNRRGVPTAHIAYEATLPKRGVAAGILLGDYLLAAANELMSKRQQQLLALFTELECHLALGQFYELSHWGEKGNEDVAEQISLFKSVQYTFTYPLRAGLLLAGRPINELDEYAYFTGLAFQMKDDWLDVNEDTTTGKDKNLDAQNEVPNIVQIYFKQNGDDFEKTKVKIQHYLADYRKKAEKALENVTLSDRQRAALYDVLLFCTEI